MTVVRLSALHTGYLYPPRNIPGTHFCYSLPEIQPLVRASGYRGFVLYSTLGHVGGGNSCGGHTLMRVATTQVG